MYRRTAAAIVVSRYACLVSKFYGLILVLKLRIAAAFLLLMLVYQLLGVRSFAEVSETIFLQYCAYSVDLHS